MFSSLLRNAAVFADAAHGDQKYGEFAYSIHLQAVQSVLLRFGICCEILLSIARLHDVIEDTSKDRAELELFFGREIADGVDDLSEPAEGTRKQRHQKTYPRIRRNWRSWIVKVADRIANVEALGSKVTMYRKEHEEFKRELPIPTNMPEEYVSIAREMVTHLDGLLLGLGATNLYT